MSTPTPKIYRAMNEVMANIGHISKNRKNQQQGYSFRGIDDIYNAIQPALVAAGVFCVPEVLGENREERPTKSGGVSIYTILKVKYTFYAEDGSSVFCIMTGEASDSGDKSSNKAMSAAQKYAFLQVFNIPTEEDKDTENHSPEFVAKPKASAPPKVDDAQKIIAAFEAIGTKLPELEKHIGYSYSGWTGHDIEALRIFYKERKAMLP